MKSLIRAIFIILLALVVVGYTLGVYQYKQFKLSLSQVADAAVVAGYAGLVRDAENRETADAVYGCWRLYVGDGFEFRLNLTNDGIIHYWIAPSARFMYQTISATGTYVLKGSALYVSPSAGQTGLFNNVGYIIGTPGSNPDVLALVDHESAMEWGRVQCI